MSEWLYEAGIGENRAALIEHGEIVEAHVEPDDAGLSLGTIAEARLIERPGAARAARIAFDDGSEALLDAIPKGLSEGRSLLVEIGMLLKREQARFGQLVTVEPVLAVAATPRCRPPAQWFQELRFRID